MGSVVIYITIFRKNKQTGKTKRREKENGIINKIFILNTSSAKQIVVNINYCTLMMMKYNICFGH